MRMLAASVAIVGMAAAWMLRFDVAPNHNGDGPSAYVLDRWTGSVTMLAGALSIPVRERTSSADEFLRK